MRKSRRLRRLWDTYRFPGFRPEPTVVGIFGDPMARIIRLRRRAKKRAAAPVAGPIEAGMTRPIDVSATFPAATRASTWNSMSAASNAGAAGR